MIIRIREEKDTTIVELLGKNRDSGNHSARNAFVLTGAYRTAGEYFNVIDEDTISVLTNYKEGESIYLQLCRGQPMKEKIILLRRAAFYSVSVYRNTFKKLCDNGAITTLEEAGIYVLRPEFYSMETGVSEEPVEHQFYEL